MDKEELVSDALSIESRIDTTYLVSELVSSVVAISSSLPQEVLSDVLTILSNEVGFKIVEFLHIHGGSTKPEMHKVLKVTYQCLKKYLGKLRKLGLVEQKSFVKRPYLAQTISRPIPIFSLVGTDPECLIQAQRRYCDLRKRNNGVDLEPIITRLDEVHQLKGLTKHNSSLDLMKVYLHDVPTSILHLAYGVYWQKRMNPEAS